MDSRTDERGPFDVVLGWLLLVAGLVGALASLVLTIEKIELIKDPTYVPSCSINPVLSCGSIMSTGQAELLGFANPLLGLLGFPALVATGAAVLAGARMRPWFWLGLQAGVTLGFVFVVWLVFQSLYRIGALCPYCMVVWVVVIPTAWYVTLANLTAGRLGAAAAGSRAVEFLARNHVIVVLLTYLLVLVLITHRFWDYWNPS